MLSAATLKAQDGTQITKIEGGAGNDTFNVKGDMGSIVIDGGAGSDEVVMGKAGRHGDRGRCGKGGRLRCHERRDCQT